MPQSTTVMWRAWARSMIVERLLAHLVDRQAAQAVVGAEADDQHLHVAVERPVETTEPARGRVAGHARVDHLELQALGVDLALEERREMLPAATVPIRRTGCRRARRRAGGRRGAPERAGPGSGTPRRTPAAPARAARAPDCADCAAGRGLEPHRANDWRVRAVLPAGAWRRPRAARLRGFWKCRPSLHYAVFNGANHLVRVLDRARIQLRRCLS